MTSEHRWDLALIIGRFQPFHHGHLSLVRHARTLAPKVCLVIGSADSAPSLENPWSLTERKAMIGTALDSDWDAVGLEDSAYDFIDWKARLHRKVHETYGPAARVVVVGHRKDESSRYLDNFPDWGLSLLDLQAGGISASALRTALFEGRHDELGQHCHPALIGMMQKWLGTPTGSNLLEEWNYCRAYRESWSKAPYEPVFVTCDTLVLHRGKILMIRRGNHPGRGLLALPGGFLEPRESLREGALRELAEETGLDALASGVRTLGAGPLVFDAPGRDPRGRMITHVFGFQLDDKLEAPPTSGSDDAREAIWVPLGDIDARRHEMFSDHWKIIRHFFNHL